MSCVQGGSGKTVAAVAVARDRQVRGSFEVILYAPLGQTPNIRDLQRSLHQQLCGRAMGPEAAATEALATDALRAAATGRKALMIVDDAWQAGPAKTLTDFLDPDTPSRALITSRIQSLVSGAVECPLGVLPPSDGARLLLTVGDAPNKEPPYAPEVLEVKISLYLHPSRSIPIHPDPSHRHPHSWRLPRRVRSLTHDVLLAGSEGVRRAPTDAGGGGRHAAGLGICIHAVVGHALGWGHVLSAEPAVPERRCP